MSERRSRVSIETSSSSTSRVGRTSESRTVSAVGLEENRPLKEKELLNIFLACGIYENIGLCVCERNMMFEGRIRNI
jgi:hypothetical protein